MLKYLEKTNSIYLTLCESNTSSLPSPTLNKKNTRKRVQVKVLPVLCPNLTSDPERK